MYCIRTRNDSTRYCKTLNVTVPLFCDFHEVNKKRKIRGRGCRALVLCSFNRNFPGNLGKPALECLRSGFYWSYG